MVEQQLLGGRCITTGERGGTRKQEPKMGKVERIKVYVQETKPNRCRNEWRKLKEGMSKTLTSKVRPWWMRWKVGKRWWWQCKSGCVSINQRRQPT